MWFISYVTHYGNHKNKIQYKKSFKSALIHEHPLLWATSNSGVVLLFYRKVETDEFTPEQMDKLSFDLELC